MKKHLFMIMSAPLIAFMLSTPVSAEKQHKQNKDIPHGLQKKADRNGVLPQGWQNKIKQGEVLDKAIYNEGKVVMPLTKDGIIGIEVDGTLIKLEEKTRKILDIIRS